MDFRQLRNFIQVVELSSITAAAERLNIAQPALSRQVKALEDELNVSLLRRHGRGVMPTEEGIRLARRAKAILEEVEDMAGDISGNSAPLSGTVTLGLPPTVAEILATHMIERTMTRFPDVKLRVISGFSGHVQDWLLRGKIDLGVAYEGQKSPSIRAQPIIIEQLFLIQSAQTEGGRDGVPIPVRDALGKPLILPNPEHGLRGRVEAISQEEQIALDVVLEIDILSTMLAFVERGLGSTILPLVSVIDHVRDGRLIARPIVQRTIDRTLVLMTPLNRPGSRLASSFAEFLTAEVHAMVATGQWPGTTL
ncbi:MAG TPA: LysR family transcriptional regulator [Citreicella sp.]|jgi:LysR family transcriptional regulator, nitrogen assimilation regulatory protein|uniref:LysR family transcriptional regulator, nitrogen assimilation regulatory protein n=1 Tax=Salipiger marinus TaxID=555512 RepID=A0A1G8P9W2_9RHOB|nr:MULTISPECIES: LysR family transcriptional regulator [Salipiger]MCD1618955.1 LysR family transcriptional regulator [Salipiger manganoxidans]SDI89351.1 LysR family transcriptional regulator, nitrogen assimilation regulatory protein [Salipiger marinus]HBM60910.1 LysR family transcriptional regulator [Citreicella sp.]